MFVLYVTVLLPLGVINDDDNASLHQLQTVLFAGVNTTT